MARLRILAIEDDAELSGLYKDLFEGEGDVVSIAGDADEAVRGLAKHPDLVLLDLRIPRGDGQALLRRIRADPAMSDTPVVVVSGSVPPGRDPLPDADIVVRKPFLVDDLLRAIHGVAGLTR